MAGKSRNGNGRALTEKEAQDAADSYLRTGSIRKAAVELGISRAAFQQRLDHAAKWGMCKPRPEGMPSRWRPADEIIAARKGEFERVKEAGDGRKIHRVHMADEGPFCIIFLGDPHLDSPGTDLKLWERWIAPLNYRKHVHGFGLGDWLDNWVRPLSFLYAQSETPAPEGWILLNHYLDQIGEHLIGSVAGNHDDWSGSSDLLGQLMRERGVTHRSKSLRLALRTPAGREVTIGSRHRFAGRSMWSEVHAIKKAARMGWRDTILVGGDKHVSGESMERDPDTGRLTWCIQVAAFKTMDDYGDDLGLMDRHVSPAIAAVIDPRRADTDPQLVTYFHEPEMAVEHLALLRRKTKLAA